MAYNVNPDQIGAVCFVSTLFASILISSVMLGNFLQQTTTADDFSDVLFLVALRVNSIIILWSFQNYLVSSILELWDDSASLLIPVVPMSLIQCLAGKFPILPSFPAVQSFT